jgi:integrase
MAKWERPTNSSGDPVPGIRFRTHETRKHGKRFDRYWCIYFKLDGRMVEESLGWESQGASLKKAQAALSRLKTARTEQGKPRTLKEEREQETSRKDAEAKAAALARLEGTTFAEVFGSHYLPWSKANKRNVRSWTREEQLFRLHLAPVIGRLPMKDVAPFHLEKVKSAMAKAGSAPRSVQYCMAVVRSVFNFAVKHDLYNGQNPVSKIRMPKVENTRLRFLTRGEAAALLSELRRRSEQTWAICLLSLHTGMRAGEVFSLAWGDVDTARGVLALRNTKSGKTRHAFMTDAVKAMFAGMERGKPGNLVFPGRGGVKIKQMGDTFNRAVDALRLNEGIADARQKVCFHTLRHSFASWLVESGTDLYHVKELMGHGDFKMTSRYSHLSEGTLQAAVAKLDAPGADAAPAEAQDGQQEAPAAQAKGTVARLRKRA